MKELMALNKDEKAIEGLIEDRQKDIFQTHGSPLP